MRKPKRKKFRQETVVHSYIVRPLAQEVVLAVWNSKITPNDLTLYRSVISVVYLWMFAMGEAWSFVFGIILFEIAEVIDHADGMLARMKRQTSRLGQFYEYVTDELFSTEYGLLGLSIAYGVYRYSGDVLPLYLVVLLMYLYGLFRYFRMTINPHLLHKEANMVIDHDKEGMLEILGLPLKKSLINLIKTVYIWKNQLLFIALAVALYGFSFSVSAVFALYIFTASYLLYRELKAGYLANKDR